MSNPGIPGFDPEPRGIVSALGVHPTPFALVAVSFATFADKYLILLQIRTKSLTAKNAKKHGTGRLRIIYT
jgi:hypothetical protein